MSGHSHFSSIKHQKAITDAKKGKAFSKVARLITLAAKTGGDPATNHKLRLAIEQAKTLNMPKDNVQRAIDRGTGKIAGEKMEEIIFEGFGPVGIAVIVEGITD
ncbi:MAG: YebC/PmpR family DNA-binding transcriptional regulator, partial [Candidatus Nealsonbacteria bacterium]|nr:YebC/PmpR family DNA-binding transcriptional regulator [Candidatus Nealsonbacteria bacterium]